MALPAYHSERSAGRSGDVHHGDLSTAVNFGDLGHKRFGPPDRFDGAARSSAEKVRESQSLNFSSPDPPASQAPCKGAVRGARPRKGGSDVRSAEEDLPEGRELLIVAIRNARPKEIGVFVAAHAGTENVSVVIAAEVTHQAEPVLCVVG